LRSGNAKDAIEYLKNAASSNSTPEYHYWLGESYLSKGDFIRALYQYQKIIELFPKDEMWAPFARYKTGIVFEFMDEFDEAKRVYKEIIKKRGIGDTWGIEAQKRLEILE
jgi:TolA-binding protein